jgi:hypothetical protein
MRVVRLEDPVVRGNAVDFAWSADPNDGFYLEPGFTLEFPESVNVAAVPAGVWLRVLLICAYSHWAVLRPCRVILPRALPDGEREFWLRLVDAAVWTLENDKDEAGGPSYTERTARAVEIIETGPPAGDLPPAPDNGLVAASFSGGRDSLTQTAMLQELGLTPLLVTTTSKRVGSIEFETERFRMVLDEAKARTGLELIEVKSNIRTSFRNDHPLVARYRLAVSELTDVLLYFAVCWATAWARGGTGVYLASEAEAQESIRRDGMVVQMEHIGFSAVTQRALAALIAPTGITYGGLTSALQHFQIQRLLDKRFTELSELQYSCYSQKDGEDVCSDCFNCLKTALHKITDGTPPADIGIDLDRVLIGRSDWSPIGDGDGENRSSVGRLYGDRMNNHIVRTLRGLDVERVAQFAPNGELSPAAREGFAKLRATALDAPDPPDEPGYRAGYLELLDEPARSGLAEIFNDYFEPDPPEEYAHLLENTRLLSDWVAAPLSS